VMILREAAFAPSQSNVLARELEDPTLALEADPPHPQSGKRESSCGMGEVLRYFLSIGFFGSQAPSSRDRL
jgi:hypothetical protein